MDRLRLAIVLAICCALHVGCSNQSTTMTNPFVQADRVPAPGTRVPTAGVASPSYQAWPAQAAPGPAAPATIPGSVGAAASNPNSLAITAAGGPAIAIPTDNQSLRFAAQPPPEPQPIVEVAARELPRGVNLGRPSPAPTLNARPTTPGVRLPGSQTFVQPTGHVAENSASANEVRQRPAIMELPLPSSPPQQVVAQTSDGFQPRGSSRTSGSLTVRPVPAEAPTTQRVGYGYGPSYQQLRGRIEYSPPIGRWKLRYIPIDGASDEFGGTVVIANPDALAGLQAGDWVTAEGNLQATASPAGSYSAAFVVTSIAHQ